MSMCLQKIILISTVKSLWKMSEKYVNKTFNFYMKFIIISDEVIFKLYLNFTCTLFAYTN